MNFEVGKASTSELEKITKEYILAHTIKGIYEGEIHYLLIYRLLREYNGMKQEKK